MTVLSKKRHVIPIVFLFMYSLILFIASLYIRSPHFGSISLEHHQWNLAAPILFTKNWLRENPFTLRFSMLGEPQSIEFHTLNERAPYLSYPPGAILPIYLFCLLFRAEPTIAMVSVIALINHFLTSLCLGLFIFVLFAYSGHSTNSSFALGIIPMTLMTFLPPPLYWFQGAFLYDQAVLLPTAVFLLLELISDIKTDKTTRVKNALRLAQLLIAIYGVLTDWFFTVFLFVVFIKRLASFTRHTFTGFVRFIISFWLPTLFVICLYIWQIYSFNMLNEVTNVLSIRVGAIHNIREVNPKLIWTLIKDHFVRGYGTTGLLLLQWSSLLLVLYCFLAKGVIKRLVVYSMLVTVPPIIHLLVFKQHAAVHDFSVLKFSFIISVVSFVTIPMITVRLIEGHYFGKNKNFSFIKSSMPILLLFLSLIYVRFQFPTFREFFPKHNPAIEKVGKAIDTCTERSDIVFSPEFQIDTYPPQFLAFSMKRIYPMDKFNGIIQKMGRTNNNYTLLFFFLTDPRGKYAQLVNKSDNTYACGGYFFAKLSRPLN